MVKEDILYILQLILYSLEKNVCRIWLPIDHEYTEKQAISLCKREQLLLALWQSSQRHS